MWEGGEREGKEQMMKKWEGKEEREGRENEEEDKR